MRVTLIGSGNMATYLGKQFMQNGHTIAQVFSRQLLHASQLAQLLQAEPINSFGLIHQEADLYIIAVKDAAIADIANAISLPQKLVLHTSGAVSKNILNTISNCYGVYWPLKMIRKNTEISTDLTAVMDGNNTDALQQIKQIFTPFSAMLITADDAMRAKMHLLASFTANFSNHLYKLAADFCAAEQIPFNSFYPIIQETAIAIQTKEPSLLQAGAAFRADASTMHQHLELLQNHPSMQELYKAISNSILSTYHHSKINT
jgi:predicted short-subunit dehydrogenase-like oxidoreductase (DUF2520 family)